MKNQLNSLQVNKLINKLNINGKILNNKKGILQEAANFYKNLYTSKVSDDEHEIKIDRFLDNTYIKQLTDQQKQLCEGNITSEEIKSVIKNMKTDKTPGIDGIPVEFYRFFWVDIGNLLVRSLIAAFITK